MTLLTVLKLYCSGRFSLVEEIGLQDRPLPIAINYGTSSIECRNCLQMIIGNMLLKMVDF